MPLISFVLPIYNESENIPKLWDELQLLHSKIDTKYSVEFIFVNDGSDDDSITQLVEIYKANPEIIKVINFTRNFGHQIAVTAGQDIAKGDAIETEQRREGRG